MPKLIAKFSKYGVFYLPPKRNTDLLTNDFLYNRGEFSVFKDMAFEKHLKQEIRVNAYRVGHI